MNRIVEETPENKAKAKAGRDMLIHAMTQRIATAKTRKEVEDEFKGKPEVREFAPDDDFEDLMEEAEKRFGERLIDPAFEKFVRRAVATYRMSYTDVGIKFGKNVADAIFKINVHHDSKGRFTSGDNEDDAMSGSTPTPRITVNGSFVAGKEAVDKWAEGSFLSVPLYHWTSKDAKQKIIDRGFSDKNTQHRDGTYFLDNPDELEENYEENGTGDVLQVRVKVNRDEFFDFANPNEKEQQILDENPALSDGELGETGKVLRANGYKAWGDGMQYGVLDPSAIGIMVDYKHK